MESKNSKQKPLRRPKPKQGKADVLNKEYTDYRQFLKDQTAQRESSARDRIAAARVKDLLEHQLAMLRLTRQMNKLLNDLSVTETKSNKYFDRPPPPHKPKKLSRKANEYIIFSGGSRGLEYSSLKKSRTGTFRMEIDVTDYEPEHLQIHTENSKTMHVKACRDSGVRKTLKIVSPAGIDIDDIVIHYPQHGVLLLEAP